MVFSRRPNGIWGGKGGGGGVFNIKSSIPNGFGSALEGNLQLFAVLMNCTITK